MISPVSFNGVALNDDFFTSDLLDAFNIDKTLTLNDLFTDGQSFGRSKAAERKLVLNIVADGYDLQRLLTLNDTARGNGLKTLIIKTDIGFLQGGAEVTGFAWSDDSPLIISVQLTMPDPHWYALSPSTLSLEPALTNGVLFTKTEWPDRIRSWIDGHYQFLADHTRAALPNAVNETYLVAAQFHNEEGRGGYFAPESGTSEAQFLLLRGLLNVYLETGDVRFKTYAVSLADRMMAVLFKGAALPQTFDGSAYYLPHWLFDVKADFTAEAYYLDKEVAFTDGAATFSADYTARKIFSVRAADATLQWANPFAKVNGTEYDVASYTTDGSTFTVTLKDAGFSGTALVAYSDLGGPTIAKNSLYEAWPVWRELEDTEVACAVDSIWWVYDCFNKLAQATGDSSWSDAVLYLKQVIPAVTDVNDFDDWFTTNAGTDDPLDLAGTYWLSTRDGAAITRNTSTGAAAISLPAGNSGNAQYGNGALSETWNTENTLEITLASASTGVLRFNIDPTPVYDASTRYTAALPLDGTGAKKTLTLHLSDFLLTCGLEWDMAYKSSTYGIYKDDASSVTTTTAADCSSVTAAYTIASGGYGQLAAYFDSSDPPSACPAVTYASDTACSIRIKDADGWYWYASMAAAAEKTTVQPAMSAFSTNGYQANSGTAPSSFTAPVEELIFDFSGSGRFTLYRLGTAQSPETGTAASNAAFSFDSGTAQSVSIYRVRFLPMKSVAYTPYVAPFTVNLLNDGIVTWRGMPYAGYQAPWIWQELGQTEGTDQVLRFLRDAQDAYEQSTGVRGPFAPCYLWDRWDAAQYGTPGTWSWNGADPNTFWGGYQYRAAESAARALANDPSLAAAKAIVTDFLTMIDAYWPSADKMPPTDFLEGKAPQCTYEEPHCVALLMRAALYAKQSGTVSESLTEPIFLRCLDYLNRLYVSDSRSEVCGTWSADPDDQVWYEYWGGEILTSLVMALEDLEGGI